MLQSSGLITLNDIATEFDGVTPHKLGEYYGVHDKIPVSGIIRFSHFYGVSLYQVKLEETQKIFNVYVGQTLMITHSSIVFGLLDTLNPDNKFTVADVYDPINGTVNVTDSYVVFSSTGPVDIPGSFEVHLKDIENFSVYITVNLNVIEEPVKGISLLGENCFIDKELGVKSALRIKPGIMCEITTGNDGEYEQYPRITNLTVGTSDPIADFTTGLNYTLPENYIEPTESGTVSDFATGIDYDLGENYIEPTELGEITDFEATFNDSQTG